jgi:hypothetical protein
MGNKRLILLGHLSVIALLLLLGWLRLTSPNMPRPLEVDELLTLKYYTWMGIQPSGEMQELKHADDLHALGPPGAWHLAMGGYCSMGRWPEPNNHIVNSLLMNVSTALAGRDEWAARLPALLGGLVFAGALYFLCGPILGWRAAAPLVAVWAWFLPHVIRYSQTARGYSWALALQVLSIILAYLLARRPRSVALGALGALTAVLSLMNLVNLAVDWWLPYYLALFLVRPHGPGSKEPPTEEAGVWRACVLAQALAVAGMTFLFFMSHLPSLYSAARQHGLEFHSAGEALRLGYEIFDGLFPDFGTKALALTGLAGLLALGGKRQDRFLTTLTLVFLGVNLLHYLLARKFPFVRSSGFFIPLLLLGAAYVAESTIRLYESALSRAAMFGVIGLLTAALAASNWQVSLVSRGFTECLELAQHVEPAPGYRYHVPVRTGTEYVVSFYGPREWRPVEAVVPDSKLAVVLLSSIQGAGEDRPGMFLARSHRLTCILGETQALPAAGPLPPNAWVFWYPDFALLGLDARDQDAYVRDSGCAFLRESKRYQIKLDVYAFLLGYVFLAGEGRDAGKSAEVVREGLRRFGGRAVVFVPTETRDY